MHGAADKNNSIVFPVVFVYNKGRKMTADKGDHMEAAKRTIRDSVFSDLFGDKRYLLQLYQTLHPEDTQATEDDLTDVTIQNVLTDDLYNDLGFRNGDRVIILVESQSPPGALISSSGCFCTWLKPGTGISGKQSRTAMGAGNWICPALNFM